MEKEDNHKVAFFVDDDQGFTELIPLMIRHPRFEIKSHCTTNGYQVIDEVIKTNPDVLFIDFNLPRVNGGQILPILRSIKTLSHMRIYFLTAYTEKEILPFVQGLEFHGVLNKMENLNVAILKIFEELDKSLVA